MKVMEIGRILNRRRINESFTVAVTTSDSLSKRISQLLFKSVVMQISLELCVFKLLSCRLKTVIVDSTIQAQLRSVNAVLVDMYYAFWLLRWFKQDIFI